MISGLYKSALSMTIEETAHDVIANNIANAGTPGFKKEGISVTPFQDVLSAASKKISNTESLYQSPTGTMVVSSRTDYSQGATRQTGNDFDAAIHGNGFFTVQTPEGTAYTRNGSFSINGENQLIMAGNPEHLVLGAGNAPIALPAAEGKMEFDSAGNISIGDTAVGKLLVTEFETPDILTRTGGNLFRAPENAEGQEADGTTYIIEHKALEMSNVDIVRELAGMIINQRNYQLGQKMIQAQDQTLQAAINEVGRAQ